MTSSSGQLDNMNRRPAVVAAALRQTAVLPKLQISRHAYAAKENQCSFQVECCAHCPPPCVAHDRQPANVSAFATRLSAYCQHQCLKGAGYH